MFCTAPGTSESSASSLLFKINWYPSVQSSTGGPQFSAGGKMYELSFCVEVVLSGEECRV